MLLAAVSCVAVCECEQRVYGAEMLQLLWFMLYFYAGWCIGQCD